MAVAVGIGSTYRLSSTREGVLRVQRKTERFGCLQAQEVHRLSSRKILATLLRSKLRTLNASDR